MESSIFQQASISVRKDREKEYDLTIAKELRDAKIKFYNQCIPKILNESSVIKNTQKQILQILSVKGYSKEFDQSLQNLQVQYLKKKAQCLPIKLIIQRKITGLKAIHIQYSPRIDSNGNPQCRYLVSAFDLFKIIHDNISLSQATIKGVSIEKFQQFLHLANLFNSQNAHELQINQELKWISNLKRSQSFKLAINAKVLFQIQKKDKTLSLINDLIHFRSLFYCLSDMEIQIHLPKSIKFCQNTFHVLWNCLKTIKKIKIQIRGACPYILLQLNSFARCILFGELALFTEITHLSFKNIHCLLQVGNKNLIAIEESLTTLFQNNQVNHLQLNQCRNFPTFPKITSLQSISVYKFYFWRQQFDIMNEVIQNNPKLKSIRCISGYKFWKVVNQEYQIKENMFNQLQNVTIHTQEALRCFSLKMSPLLPSKIKHLSVSSRYKDIKIYLLRIFPKLFNLTYLYLQTIGLQHEVLLIIPSPFLEQLHLLNSFRIKGEGIKEIVLKWPQLRHITLKCCKRLQFSDYAEAFKGLMELTTDDKALSSQQFLQLAMKGIKVTIQT